MTGSYGLDQIQFVYWIKANRKINEKQKPKTNKASSKVSKANVDSYNASSWTCL